MILAIVVLMHRMPMVLQQWWYQGQDRKIHERCLNACRAPMALPREPEPPPSSTQHAAASAALNMPHQPVEASAAISKHAGTAPGQGTSMAAHRSVPSPGRAVPAAEPTHNTPPDTGAAVQEKQESPFMPLTPTDGQRIRHEIGAGLGSSGQAAVLPGKVEQGGNPNLKLAMHPAAAGDPEPLHTASGVPLGNLAQEATIIDLMSDDEECPAKPSAGPITPSDKLMPWLSRPALVSAMHAGAQVGQPLADGQAAWGPTASDMSEDHKDARRPSKQSGGMPGHEQLKAALQQGADSNATKDILRNCVREPCGHVPNAVSEEPGMGTPMQLLAAQLMKRCSPCSSACQQLHPGRQSHLKTAAQPTESAIDVPNSVPLSSELPPPSPLKGTKASTADKASTRLTERHHDSGPQQQQMKQEPQPQRSGPSQSEMLKEKSGHSQPSLQPLSPGDAAVPAAHPVPLQQDLPVAALNTALEAAGQAGMQLRVAFNPSGHYDFIFDKTS